MAWEINRFFPPSLSIQSSTVPVAGGRECRLTAQRGPSQDSWALSPALHPAGHVAMGNALSLCVPVGKAG